MAPDGVSVEVLDLRTLVPLDMDTILASVAKTRRALVVHDATVFAGPGAEIATQINEELFGELAAPVGRLGAPYSPVPFSAGLDFQPTEETVAAAVRDLVAR